MVNALRCDVWVLCACIVVCIVACFIGFWDIFFVGSASLHDLFLHFLAKCFFCNFEISSRSAVASLSKETRYNSERTLHW